MTDDEGLLYKGFIHDQYEDGVNSLLISYKAGIRRTPGMIFLFLD